MKVKTKVKAGKLSANHNESFVGRKEPMKLRRKSR